MILMELVERIRKNADTAVATTHKAITIQNPPLIFKNGTSTFIPQILAMSVGMLMMRVTTVRSFMTMFMVVEMIEA